MIIQEKISLAEFTTFKIGGPARFFCSVKNIADIEQAVRFAHDKNIPFFILGGGSNILISDNGFRGLVIKMEIEGKAMPLPAQIGDGRQENGKLKMENEKTHIITVGAGEVWDGFVEWTLANGFNGLENLSAIPGTVGAAPVQNIGAYGTEVGQFITAVHAFDTKEMKEIVISGRDCHFGYRNSLFKFERGRYIVTSVDFVLRRDGKVNIEYKDLKEYFNAIAAVLPTPSNVREAVIDIRRNKLPDWKKWGTAGSFFKNPVITKEKYDELKAKYPTLPGFAELDAQGRPASGKVKIPLGWVLDNICKVKGIMNGSVGTYERQALVVVTKVGATANEVVAFTQDLMKQVKEKTGITVEAEVEWVN